MKTSDPSAYTDIKEVTTGTPAGAPFRGLILTGATSGTTTYSLSITTIASVVRSIVINVAANQTVNLPLAGNNVTPTITGNGKFYVVM
jgi:hypothetical protein